MGNLCSQLEVRDPETYQVNLQLSNFHGPYNRMYAQIAWRATVNLSPAFAVGLGATSWCGHT